MTDLSLSISFGDSYAPYPPSLVIGTTLVVRMDALDASGRSYAATGARIIARRPDGIGLVFADANLTAIGTGAWSAAIGFDQAGTWYIRPETDMPQAEASEIAVPVRASLAVQAGASSPFLTTQDIDPVATQDGKLVTVQRVTALPAAITLDGTEAVLTVQGGVAKQATVAQLAAAAGAGSLTTETAARIAADNLGLAHTDAGDVATLAAAMGYADVAKAAAIAAAPVQRVAGRSGAVTLAVADVSGAAPLASPALTGTPTVPTPAADNNTTLAASTAFVLGQAGTAAPIVSGTAAAGSSLRFARQDHVHPTDTTRAPLAAPAFTGSVTLASWATAGRPSPAVAGMIGWNTDLARFDHCVVAGTPGTWKQMVRLDGDTMTGALVLNADPAVALGAATKQYVDGRSGVVTVAGRTGAVTLAVADVSGAAPLANPVFSGSVSLPSWTTAGRPSPATAGMIGWNTDLARFDHCVVAGTPGTWKQMVRLDGDTMTGPLTLPGGSTNPLHAITLGEVNNKLGLALYGDGSDGNVTVNGAVTLTRDTFYNNLTLTTGATLNTAGFRIFVAGTLDMTAAPAGAIQCDGTAGTVGNSSGALKAAPTGTSAGTLGTSNTAGNGSAGGTAAGTGGAAPGSSAVYLGGLVSTGGAGGAGGTGANGGGSGTGSPALYGTLRRWTADLLRGISLVIGGTSGGGGGGGGGDGTNSGGSGGTGAVGAGIVWISARIITRGGSTAAAALRANGQVGGDGGAPSTGNAGGGGGGAGSGGGLIFVAYGSLTGTVASGACQANGGAGGAGGNKSGTGAVGAGGRGAAGGRVLLLDMTAGAITETVGGAGTANSGQTAGAGGTCSAAL